jgi:hypothetical protein
VRYRDGNDGSERLARAPVWREECDRDANKVVSRPDSAASKRQRPSKATHHHQQGAKATHYHPQVPTKAAPTNHRSVPRSLSPSHRSVPRSLSPNRRAVPRDVSPAWHVEHPPPPSVSTPTVLAARREARARSVSSARVSAAPSALGRRPLSASRQNTMVPEVPDPGSDTSSESVEHMGENIWSYVCEVMPC